MYARGEPRAPNITCKKGVNKINIKCLDTHTLLFARAVSGGPCSLAPTAHRDTETPPAILSTILPLRRSRCKWFAQRTVLEPTSSTTNLVHSLKASRRTIATHNNGQSLAFHTNPLYCSHEPWLPLLIIKTTRILRRLLPPHMTLPAPRPLPPPL